MRVPVYDAPSVAPSALPEVRSRLNFDNGLGAVGQGIQQAGQGIQRAVDVHAHEQRVAMEKAADGAATAAQNGYANEVLTLLHGTPDGKTAGFFNLQGAAALAESAPTQDRLQALRKKYAEKLSPEARALFVPRTDALLLGYRRSIETYAGNQNDAANIAAAKASVGVLERTSRLQYADDHLIGVATAAAEAAVAKQLQGMPGEVIQQAINEVRQKAATARVQAAIAAEDLPAAERLLYGEGSAKPQEATLDPTGEASAQHGALKAAIGADRSRKVSAVFGAAGPQLERMVVGMRSAADVNEISTGIFNSAQIDGYPWHDAQQMREQVQRLQPGPITNGVSQKDRIAAHVEQLIRQDNQNRETYAKSLLNQAQAIYEQTGSLTNPRLAAIREEMLDLPNQAAGMWRQFEHGVRVEQRAAKTSSAAERRAQNEADRQAFYDYMAHPLEDRAGLDVEKEYLGSASRTARERIRAQQQKDRVQVAKGASVGEGAFSSYVRAQASRAGIGNDHTVSQFAGFMTAWRAQWLEDHPGKLPSWDEVRKATGDALLYDTGGWFGAGRFKFQIKPGQTFEAAPAKEQRSPLDRVETSASVVPAAPARSAAGLNLDESAAAAPVTTNSGGAHPLDTTAPVEEASSERLAGLGLAPRERVVAKRQYSPSRNQTRIVYSDGSTEVVNGRAD